MRRLLRKCLLLQYCSKVALRSKQAPHTQPDADGAKKEQKQEEEARGILISESSMFEFQQLEYYATVLWSPFPLERRLRTHVSVCCCCGKVHESGPQCPLVLAKRVGQEEETGAKQTHAVFGPKCFLYREGSPKVFLEEYQASIKRLPRRIPSEH